jgi:hypothetical protein
MRGRTVPIVLRIWMILFLKEGHVLVFHVGDCQRGEVVYRETVELFSEYPHMSEIPVRGVEMLKDSLAG